MNKNCNTYSNSQDFSSCAIMIWNNCWENWFYFLSLLSNNLAKRGCANYLCTSCSSYTRYQVCNLSLTNCIDFSLASYNQINKPISNTCSYHLCSSTILSLIYCFLANIPAEVTLFISNWHMSYLLIPDI